MIIKADVAQLVEQLIRNQKVVGSTPVIGSIFTISYIFIFANPFVFLEKCNHFVTAFTQYPSINRQYLADTK